jgi:hypothetical protein
MLLPNMDFIIASLEIICTEIGGEQRERSEKLKVRNQAMGYGKVRKSSQK